MIQPGELRHSITVKALSSVRDAFGADSDEYVDYLFLRAAVKFNSGNRGINNEEIFNSSTIQFITYYRTITTDMIIEWRSKRYRILSIADIGYREGLTINKELINE